MKFISTVAILIGLTAAVAAQEYITPEFRAGNSHIALSYSCAVLGMKIGVEPEGLAIVGKAMDSGGISSEKSGQFLADALTWWDAEGQRMADIGMWDEFCAQPMSNLKRLFGS